MCAEYDVDAETFIEQWMAFSLTALNGAEPSLENLNLLERRELSKRSESRNGPASEAPSTGKSPAVYGAPASLQYPFRSNIPRVFIFIKCLKFLN